MNERAHSHAFRSLLHLKWEGINFLGTCMGYSPCVISVFVKHDFEIPRNLLNFMSKHKIGIFFSLIFDIVYSFVPINIFHNDNFTPDYIKFKIYVKGKMIIKGHKGSQPNYFKSRFSLLSSPFIKKASSNNCISSYDHRWIGKHNFMFYPFHRL